MLNHNELKEYEKMGPVVRAKLPQNGLKPKHSG